MGFNTFLGNAQAVQAVRGMLAGGRVPGALLFTGPDGVGKKTLALMLARAVNCERPPGGIDYCGDCARCRKAEEMLAATREDLARRREIKDSQHRVEGLVYFDLQLIEPITRFILIEQIRQLRVVAYTRPFEFSRRMFVIDQAQTIHWQAIDLLLKVLEEPPETTTLILVCSNAFELRPTIRSRCQRVPFRPVDETVIRDLIKSERRIPKAHWELAVRIARGSVAAARSFDAKEFELRRRPWVDFLESFARNRRGELVSPNWDNLFAASKALTEQRDQFEDTLRMGYLLLEDLEHLVEEGGEGAVANIDIIRHLQAWAQHLGLRGVAGLKEGFDQASRLQVRNVNQRLGLETLAIDLLEQSGAPQSGPATPVRSAPRP